MIKIVLSKRPTARLSFSDMVDSIHASSKTAVEAHKPQRTSMEQKRGKGNGAFLNAFTFTNKTHSPTEICLKLH